MAPADLVIIVHAFMHDQSAPATSDPAAGRSLAQLRVLVIGSGLIGTSVGLALRRHGTDVLLTDHLPERAARAAARGAGRVWSASAEHVGALVGAVGGAGAGAVVPRQKTAEPGKPTVPAGAAADPAVVDHASINPDLINPGVMDPSLIDHAMIDGATIDHVVLAVPPSRIGAVLAAWQRRLPAATFSDTGSVKVRPIIDAQELGADMSRLCGAHPISGREHSGPDWATADLFAGRPWVLTPTLETSERAVRHARLIVSGCGAQVIEMRPEMHDVALGLLSHLPHVVASVVASRLVGVPDEIVRLAGPGLWDFTRIAAANADLWSDIVVANASPLSALLAEVVADLGRLQAALSALGAGDVNVRSEVEHLFRQGNTGRDRLVTANAGRGIVPAPAPPPVAERGTDEERPEARVP
ncbi:prephenate dehydrogenase/arogenate dehydrogenase family protein [Frankia sp. AiPa1]|uniref:prephenate dehydrogenase/arogenate dehydrogenase family protein n=1 Tax=Frankia sp. AiPa1 TaxID=573492 RepID=UPI00202B1D43|nr:prephenate dehydrogenase/arogenate dehydrogenase family protein [Frankia sp. AiPa1]MCL9758325.1 prephenate dehydrogenase/arogenate dehydrogenase family protein [Frankia sp. AiPa1]